jgi:hypothetical protein
MGYTGFVVKGELDSDRRELSKEGRGLRCIFSVFEKEDDDAAAMQSIAGESDEESKITEIPEWAAKGE